MGSAQLISELSPSTSNVYIANRLTGNGVIDNALVLNSLGNSQAIRNVNDAQRKVSDTGGFRQTIDGWNKDGGLNTLNGELTRAAGRFRALRAGSITGLLVASTSDRLTGSLEVTVWKNTLTAGGAGAATTLEAELNGTDLNRAVTLIDEGDITIQAGDEIFLHAVATGWTPAAANLRCAIDIED